MKKRLSLLLLLVLTLLVAFGCSQSKDISQPNDNDLETQDATEVEARKVDVDLTVFSSTMLYAKVNSIMTTPDNYMGKRIKMSGIYSATYFEETELFYHYVIIEDTAACCVQGLEFIWNGDHAYPDDYPEDNANIEVIGVLDSYDELDNTYYYLSVDDISVIT